MNQRAEDRIGDDVLVHVESVDAGTGGEITGRAEHQGPDVDGITTLTLEPGQPAVARGDFVAATVVDAVGVDLVARVRP